MPRPTILVAEPEPLEALSTRKLVLETGKFNVLTAHSTAEAIELFNMFPNVSAAVIAEGRQVNAVEIARTIRTTTTKPRIIYLSPSPGAKGEFADDTLSSYEPVLLLELLRSLFGDPRELDKRTQE